MQKAVVQVFQQQKTLGAINRLGKLIQKEEGLVTVETRLYSPNFFHAAHRDSNMRAGGRALKM
jgi:hypothetical protein